MKNTFNPGRFGRLFIKHTAEHYKSYLMSLLVLLGVMILGGIFIIYMINVPMEVGMQTALFSAVLLLAGTIFTSTVFAELGDKKRAISWLTLPASHFEKYLVVWLYSFLVLIIIYTTCFYLVLLFLTSVKHFPGQHNEIFDIFYRGGGMQIFVLYGFLHSIAFYGAIRFEKLHFIKTAFAFFISITILIVVNNVMLQLMFGRGILLSIPFGVIGFPENNKVDIINITEAQQVPTLATIGLIACVFWAAAYYRLKEKQV